MSTLLCIHKAQLQFGERKKILMADGQKGNAWFIILYIGTYIIYLRTYRNLFIFLPVVKDFHCTLTLNLLIFQILCYKVTCLYLNSVDDEYGPVARTVLETLKESGVRVQAALTWESIYHHGYMKNPFDELVESTFMDTRSELFCYSDFLRVFCGHYYDIFALSF